MTNETLQGLRDFYIPERLTQIDPDFLEFEEEMADEEILGILLGKCYDLYSVGGMGPLDIEYWDNPHNSILLYLTGLTNQFDFEQGRSDTIDGSPPDIDIDFDSLDRHKAIQWVVEHWGRENVAQIGTFPTFKPKGMADIWGRVNERSRDEVKAIKKKIPDDVFGKAAKLSAIVTEHPGFPEDHPDYYATATKLEGMVLRNGIHAGGVIISDFPIADVIPMSMKKEKTDKYNIKKIEKWVTQLDMKEVENLGLIKFDFLAVENLSIIKEICALIKQEHGIEIDPRGRNIPEDDPKAFKLMHHGLMTGLFQMETSGSAKDLVQKILPTTLTELSDISALNRPGPMSAGLDQTYIDNKRNGYAPSDLPDAVAEILKNNYWTLIYQEDVMKLTTDLAGFTLQEADDVRRAMGKKDGPVLLKWKDRFVNGCIEHAGLSESYVEELWEMLAGDPDDPENNGFADYCLAGDTRIRTSCGGWMTIEGIGDHGIMPTVISTLEDGSTKHITATQWHDNGKQECFTYTMADGDTVTCTPNHQFMTEEGNWVDIDTAWKKNISLKKY
jgi:DNA polymerase-3 subunit alpha